MTIKEYEKRRDNGEPIMRSCWQCNSAHNHLKKADYIIWCFLCGKLYYKGKPLIVKGEKN